MHNIDNNRCYPKHPNAGAKKKKVYEYKYGDEEALIEVENRRVAAEKAVEVERRRLAAEKAMVRILQRNYIYIHIYSRCTLVSSMVVQ